MYDKSLEDKACIQVSIMLDTILFTLFKIDPKGESNSINDNESKINVFYESYGQVLNSTELPSGQKPAQSQQNKNITKSFQI